MRRSAASLLLVVLLVGCGKYGPPRRVRPEPPAPSEVVESAESPADEEEDQEKAP